MCVQTSRNQHGSPPSSVPHLLTGGSNKCDDDGVESPVKVSHVNGGPLSPSSQERINSVIKRAEIGAEKAARTNRSRGESSASLGQDCQVRKTEEDSWIELQLLILCVYLSVCECVCLSPVFIPSYASFCTTTNKLGYRHNMRYHLLQSCLHLKCVGGSV